MYLGIYFKILEIVQAGNNNVFNQRFIYLFFEIVTSLLKYHDVLVIQITALLHLHDFAKYHEHELNAFSQ